MAIATILNGQHALNVIQSIIKLSKKTRNKTFELVYWLLPKPGVVVVVVFEVVLAGAAI